jgi:hypothetical protein
LDEKELKVIFQRESLFYLDFSDRYLSDLEGRIEKSIIEGIESWREGRITRWNK